MCMQKKKFYAFSFSRELKLEKAADIASRDRSKSSYRSCMDALTGRGKLTLTKHVKKSNTCIYSCHLHQTAPNAWVISQLPR